MDFWLEPVSDRTQTSTTRVDCPFERNFLIVVGDEIRVAEEAKGDWLPFATITQIDKEYEIVFMLIPQDIDEQLFLNRVPVEAPVRIIEGDEVSYQALKYKCSISGANTDLNWPRSLLDATSTHLAVSLKPVVPPDECETVD